MTADMPLGVELFQTVHIFIQVTENSQIHSCQPLLGVNLSPEFVNLYLPYAGRGLLSFRW